MVGIRTRLWATSQSRFVRDRVTRPGPRGSWRLRLSDAQGETLLEEIRYRAGGPHASVRVVAPALTGRLRYWASDEDRAYAAADARLAESLRKCRVEGCEIEGAVGDPDLCKRLTTRCEPFSRTR